MDAYLANNTQLVGALALYDTLILDEDVTMIALGGLGLEYDSLVASFTSNLNNMVDLVSSKDY